MASGKACSHLVADGSYRDACEKLIDKYPNLKHPGVKYGKMMSALSATSRARFRFLSIDLSSGMAKIGDVATNLADVQQRLRIASQGALIRCVHIVEGRSPELFALLGNQLQVDPRVFMRQQKSTVYEAEQNGGHTPCLASSIDPSSSYTLQSYDARHFAEDVKGKSLFCADTLRPVLLPLKDGRLDGVTIIWNKVSFWSRKEGEDGWQALILVDPPPIAFLQPSANSMDFKSIPNSRYQGGYADFISYPDLESMKNVPAPPRTSMFDDLQHYYSHHSDALKINKDVSSADLFVRKIVASQYMLLGQYCGGLLGHLEWQITRDKSIETLTVQWLHQQWDVIQLYHRRTEHYARAVRAIVRDLKLSASNSHMDDHWRSSKIDFEDIQATFDHLLQKSESLITSFSTLASIISSRESLAEAETIGRVTILGMVFLPLSFATGLFSMSESYLPGAKDFRFYWAVAIPMLSLNMFIPYVYLQLQRVHTKHLIRAHQGEYRYWEEHSSPKGSSEHWKRRPKAFSEAE